MQLVFLVLRLFIAFFLTVFGLGLAAKTEDQGQLLVGAVLGAVGLTFLFLLWAAQKKSA